MFLKGEQYGGRHNALGLPDPSFADYFGKGKEHHLMHTESPKDISDQEKESHGRPETEKETSEYSSFHTTSSEELKHLIRTLQTLQSHHTSFHLECRNPDTGKWVTCSPEDIKMNMEYRIKTKEDELNMSHPGEFFHGGSLSDLHPLNIRGGGIKQLAKTTINLFNPMYWKNQKRTVQENLQRKGPIGKHAETRAFMSAEAYKPKDKRKDIENYKYLKEHSSNTHAVYMDPVSGRKILAYRGTKPSQASDLKADVGIATGTVASNKRFKQGLKTLDQLKQKLGSENWETTGHSLGATMALYTAQKHGIQSHAFNPGFVNATDDDINTKYKKHNIYVNASDPLSNDILKRKHEGNLKVVSSFSRNPIKSHSIQGFLRDVQPAEPSQAPTTDIPQDSDL